MKNAEFVLEVYMASIFRLNESAFGGTNIFFKQTKFRVSYGRNIDAKLAFSNRNKPSVKLFPNVCYCDTANASEARKISKIL
jgi:hypothetical protein